jgi:hypothetical protein
MFYPALEAGFFLVKIYITKFSVIKINWQL